MLHSYFSDILGTEFSRPHTLDLQALRIEQLDLSALDLPFTEEEIWWVIKELKPDKAPGPDGFTAAFYQTAWHIIKGDILAAFNAFYTVDRRQFRCVNGALLTLLPKILVPKSPKDYRPISLIHSFAKLVAKLLSKRLSPHLHTLISCNQTAFVKGRSILDSFKYVQRTAILLRKKKVPKFLLKLDISKVFDTVAWPFVLEVLEAWGFGQRWRDWIALLLSTASTRILLNGQPGAPIHHLRDLRQGDPLSPMLFILAMDVLNRLFTKAAEEGLLQPLGHRAIKFRCSMYADDVMLLA